MKNKVLLFVGRLGIVMLALATLTIGATAQDDAAPANLCGFINDYSTATGGPWEIRGTWCLKIHKESSKAEFSAAFTMVGVSDVTSATARHAHTHHIKLTDGTVVPSPDGNGFLVSDGTLIITGNGNYPPDFEPPASTLAIHVFGGNTVPFSNIRLTFGGGAGNHLGSIAGVVRKVSGRDDDR